MQIEATLNLSEGFGQWGESIPFHTSRFPAGEVYIKVEVPRAITRVRINSRCTDSIDLMRIFMACDALQRQGVTYIELFIPYFPYSRQDRVCKEGEAFSLKVVCWMLLSVCTKIVTYDVHSNVTQSLLDTMVKDYDNHREVLDFLDFINRDGKERFALICPDAGASKKCEALYNTGMFEAIVYCSKQRKNGTVVIGDIHENLHGLTAIVVDDICDGGRTFVELGKVLKNRHADHMHLFVSHGIFSAGMTELRKFYRKIGTTNSMNEKRLMPEGVRVFELDY